jgi:Na+-translocating ferredoxin:NAD+ oxidoreductase RnfG subunit
MRELERAFQLAQSGTVRSIDDIRVRLRKEGYSASQLTGRTLIKQLRAIINSVQTERRVE